MVQFKLFSAAAICTLLTLVSCASAASPASTPTGPVTIATPTPASVPTALAAEASAAQPNSQATGTTLSQGELKYRLINQFAGTGNSKAIVYCDPDVYPVARLGGEATQTAKLFPAIQQDQETFQAILTQLNLVGTTSFTPDQQLLIYREYKVLNIIGLQPIAGGYQFGFSYYDHNSSSGVSQVSGIIGADGKITIQQSAPGAKPQCPICLVAGTLIDSPTGPIAVKDLQVGMKVWTMDKHGNRQAAPILKTARVTVPFGHMVIHLRLSDGRELWASPPHPTADGRPLGSLQLGDSLDGAIVISVERMSYPDGATYDILPAGDTGFYWAEGILMGSTLVESIQF